MNSLEIIQKDLSPLLDKVNITIRESLYSTNIMLKGIIDFFLAKRGKQIRPIFTLLIADLLGKSNEKTINGAAAIELLHNASLIHDDVVDNSEIRRNANTLNKIWDNQIAVLVGDFFVTSALERALSTGNISTVTAISELGRQLAVGELDQIYNAKNNILDEQAYIKMIELKTASLFITCATIGAQSVNASKEDTEKVCEFARLLGICFQIKDDTFDYFKQESGRVGKPVEADLLEGKISLPLLHVLIKDREAGKQEYIELCKKENLSQSEVQELVEYARNNSGIDYAVDYMNNLYKQALLLLESFSNTEATSRLDQLFRYVIERDY